jgi:hypothetical protein
MRLESVDCYCHKCGRTTTHTRRVGEVNHVMHLLIGLLTCGAWWFLWLFLVATASKTAYRCQECD